MASSYEVDSTSDCMTSSLGYHSLKLEQKAVIKEFVMGKDVFAIFPTGYGKSLCYACLPGVFNKLFGSTLSIVAVTNTNHCYRYHVKISILYVINYVSTLRIIFGL